MTDQEIAAKFPLKLRSGLRVSNLGVLQSGAGYFIGRTCWDTDHNGFEDMYSRESDYYPDRTSAEKALHDLDFYRDAAELDFVAETEGLPRIGRP